MLAIAFSSRRYAVFMPEGLYGTSEADRLMIVLQYPFGLALMTEEAEGKESRELLVQALPSCCGAERNMGSEQRPSLDAQTWAPVQALSKSLPCSPLPCSPASAVTH